MDQAGRIHGNTTTTTTITETHVQTNIRFDPTYVKTLPGALKLAAVVRIVIEFRVLVWKGPCKTPNLTSFSFF